MIDCALVRTPIANGVVDNAPLQIRAKVAGLAQKRLAELLGVTPTTVGKQLKGEWASGTPRYVIAMLIAWEGLPHEKRVSWLGDIEAVERELQRREGQP